MGLLDSVIGSLTGGGNNQNQGSQGQSGIGGVLSELLGGGGTTGGNQASSQGGNQANSQGGLGGMLGGGSSSGGIGGLVSMFESAGLGHIVQSWIGNGQNSSVSPDQLNGVLGDKVPGMAQKAGMNQGDFLSQLSQHLPGAVDQSTPNGQVDNGSVSV